MNKFDELKLKKNNKGLKGLYIFSLMALIVTLYILFFIDNYGYKFIWLLPFSYFVSTSLYYSILKKIKYNHGIVFIVANVAIFIRFVVTPFAMVFTSRYNGGGYGLNPSPTSINYAIILMILELIVIYSVIIFAIIYYKRKQNNGSYTKSPTYFLKNKSVILLFLLFSLPIVLTINPTSLIPKSFSSLETISSISDLNVPDIIKILSSVIRSSILLVSLSFIKDKYDRINNIFYIFIAWGIVFLYLGASFSSSRWTLLFSSIICLVLMSKLFPKTPKVLYLVVIFITILGIITASIYKFSWSIRNSANPYQDIFGVVFGQFQEYFSGPRVVAQSLDMQSVYGEEIGLSTFLNDFLGSIPKLANFINQNDRINIYFNRYLNMGNVTQIIPMIGQGYNYFPFFPMMFTSVAEWLMVRFDYKTNASQDIEFKYIYAYIGFYFSMSMGFNTQIIWGNFLTSFFPLWILFKVNRKVKMSRQKTQDSEGL